MSKYTTEVRFICETYAGYDESQGERKVDEIIEEARGHIFDYYPIFDEAYRPVLERKILRHYYTREIGLETVGLWKLHLNTKMQEIMPYFNKLYVANNVEFNPFYDIDLTRQHEGQVYTDVVEGENASTDTFTNSESNDSSSSTYETSGSSTSNADNINKFSDTPQGGLEGLREDRYMSSASMDENNTNTSDSRTSTEDANSTAESSSNGNSSTARNLNRDVNTTDNYVERVFGKQGVTSYSRLYKEYMDSIINIDLRVIDALAPLFMNIW